MDKLDLHSRDILGGNVEKIGQLFPGVVTEVKDEQGNTKKAVDFDLLRQHLSDELVEGDRERFRLDWPGKRASILKANTPTTKTLRPVREDSVDFDTTQNVFIEGDNFEVLKVLQESYLGKVKMIYIDPPYNTGKDFIYKDNFAADKAEYEEELGVRDDENGGKLVKNTETNGRYHSDWLSMMQERLIVARDLLTDDGVIFISIDDNEQSRLKGLCDEVFGEGNFIGNLIIENNPKGRKNARYVSVSSEYCLAYARDAAHAESKFLESIPKGIYKIDEYGRKYT
ncbi:MAG: site-specific DNA-methyltransferase, partial [Candidatus Saccharimonadales bacterium]